MTTGLISALLMMLMCWNLFLHRRLSSESQHRRELAIAFRQHLIERRQTIVPAA
jgi:hypothetical protein